MKKYFDLTLQIKANFDLSSLQTSIYSCFNAKSMYILDSQDIKQNTTSGF